MKAIILSVVIAGTLVGGAFAFGRSENPAAVADEIAGQNVTIVDGKQIVTITARGGYQPRRSVAQAGLPTILRFDTKGTFDCSSAVRIASLDINQNLPQTGTTDIDIGVGESGILQGSCGMGMYPFEVVFEG